MTATTNDKGGIGPYSEEPDGVVWCDSSHVYTPEDGFRGVLSIKLKVSEGGSAHDFYCRCPFCQELFAFNANPDELEVVGEPCEHYKGMYYEPTPHEQPPYIVVDFEKEKP